MRSIVNVHVFPALTFVSFSVFAPTDGAFDDLPDDTLKELSEEDLADILLYHVLSGKKVFAEDLEDGQKIKMANGDKTKISLHPAKIDNARIKITDLEAKNGVVHVINKVLLP